MAGRGELRLKLVRPTRPLLPRALGLSTKVGGFRQTSNTTPPQQRGHGTRNVRSKFVAADVQADGPLLDPHSGGSQTHKRGLSVNCSMPQGRHSRASLHRACRRGRTPPQLLAGTPPPSETKTARGLATARWTPPGSPWSLLRRTACLPRGAPWRRIVPPTGVTQKPPPPPESA